MVQERDMFPEGEAMSVTTPPAGVVLTGSTGINPLTDGTFRAMLLALPAAILAFIHIEYGFLSTEGFAALAVAIAPAGVLLWAVFDRYVKRHLMGA